MTKGTEPRLYEFRGAKCTVYEIADQLDVSEGLVYKRIRAGIAPDDMKPNSGVYSTHIIEYNGKSQSITEWGRELGIGDDLIRSRIKQGMTMDRVMSTESQRENKHTFRGELKTAKEIAEILGVSRQSIARKIRLGQLLE